MWLKYKDIKRNRDKRSAIYRAPVGQHSTIALFSQPLKIKNFKRFLFSQALKIFINAPGIG